MDMQEIVIYGLVAGAVLSVGVSFALTGGNGKASVSLKEPGWNRLPPIFKMLWGFILIFDETLGASLASAMPSQAKRYDSLCKTAALPLSGVRVLTCMFCAAVAMTVVGGLFAVGTYMMFPGFGVVAPVAVLSVFILMGWFWPSQALARNAELRQAEISRQLPFAIDLIGSAMRSGLEFGAAVRYYTGLRTGGALEEEFNVVLNDVMLNKPFIEALKDMADRVQFEAFTAFVGVVSYGNEIGASITETLKMQGKDLRRARFALAERTAARAPAVMIIPLVLFIMPAVFIVIITPVVLRYKAMGLGAN